MNRQSENTTTQRFLMQSQFSRYHIFVHIPNPRRFHSNESSNYIRSSVQAKKCLEFLFLAKSHLSPVIQDLFLQLLGIRTLKVCRYPIPASCVFSRHKSIRNNFTTHGLGMCPVTHVWNQWETAHIFKEGFVRAGTTSCRERPHDVLAIVDVDIVTTKY